ncbi:MAG: threonine--tRNA ligase [Clostridia bacterium]|nr:threonine--tRNA ligase [Clostridia bacterium]
MEDKEKLEKIQMCRHSLSHVLAKAVKNVFGKENVKLAIGPAIDNGFYYDFDMQSVSPEQYELIEKEMKNIINKNEQFKRVELSREEALKLFENEPYKIELINELPDEEPISCYYLGEDFVDLCRGPHVECTAKLQSYAYKIGRISGAYWRGSEKNKMLQRVYVYAFADKKQLNDYINQLEEAKKRDHNKLGRELEYFTTVDYIGQGLPVMLPKGAKTIQIMQRFVEDEEERRGYLLTKTPFMSKNDLFKISGHWDHYKDSMFVLGDEEKDKEVFCLRPMTCPFQYQVYLNKPRSYKDLPMRLGETSTLFRNEASGECHGLIRVRQFTISEGHLMVRPDQLEDEFKGCLDLATYMLKTLGLYEDVSFRFSKWDENNKEKYIGSKEEWEKVQGEMRRILNDLNIDYFEADGEAAFYGPKLDIQIKNVHGKEDTIITIQIDFQIAERFGMYYIGEDGQKKLPYIIHRTSLGCYERTLAYLIEKYAGALPLWLCAEQVKVMNISENSEEYAREINNILQANGLRSVLDVRNEKIGYKIREAVGQKIPYMIIVGDGEKENNTISIRGRGNENSSGLKLEDFIARLKEEIKTFKR